MVADQCLSGGPHPLRKSVTLDHLERNDPPARQLISKRLDIGLRNGEGGSVGTSFFAADNIPCPNQPVVIGRQPRLRDRRTDVRRNIAGRQDHGGNSEGWEEEHSLHGNLRLGRISVLTLAKDTSFTTETRSGRATCSPFM